MSQVTLAEYLSYKFEKNIFYRDKEKEKTDSDTLIESKCRLDIYYPENQQGLVTLIYFHGGGLTIGDKEIPSNFYNRKIITVSPNYRLSPESKCPSYIEDCTAAVAWTFKHIKEYGGDPNSIYISGSSSGAYLATLIFMNKNLLSKYDIDADSLAGLFSFSGQMTTHFTICRERGLNVYSDTQIVDEYAPLNYVRMTLKPMYFYIGDSTLDMPGRYVQNKEMTNRLKDAGNPNVYLRELKGKDHLTMTSPCMDSTCIILRKIIASVDTNKTNSITISPNPIRNGVFKINVDETITKLSIFDAVGGLAKTFINISHQPINVQGIKKGTYIVEGKTKTRNFRQKILIL